MRMIIKTVIGLPYSVGSKDSLLPFTIVAYLEPFLGVFVGKAPT